MSRLLAAATLLALAAPARADGDAARGSQAFQICAPCHSLQPDRNMTGPSLAGVWGRSAGSLASFQRYSPALKDAKIVWDERTLDPWLADPASFVAGNRMTFPGLKDEQAQADLIAYLKTVPASGAADAGARRMGGMMMGAGQVRNLKKLDPGDRVEAITRCGDTYRVKTADGKTQEFWEPNLRFKTDSSDDGPQKGAPAIVPAGMMGDRASVVFASPEEISASIRFLCP